MDAATVEAVQKCHLNQIESFSAKDVLLSTNANLNVLPPIPASVGETDSNDIVPTGLDKCVAADADRLTSAIQWCQQYVTPLAQAGRHAGRNAHVLPASPRQSHPEVSQHPGVIDDALWPQPLLARLAVLTDTWVFVSEEPDQAVPPLSPRVVREYTVAQHGMRRVLHTLKQTQLRAGAEINPGAELHPGALDDVISRTSVSSVVADVHAMLAYARACAACGEVLEGVVHSAVMLCVRALLTYWPRTCAWYTSMIVCPPVSSSCYASLCPCLCAHQWLNVSSIPCAQLYLCRGVFCIPCRV